MTDKFIQIALQKLLLDKDQPRQELEGLASDTEFRTLKGLAQSIKQVGILQPLRVRKLPGESYQILSGHRRFEAAKLAGMEDVPCIVVAQTHDAADVRLAQITENVQRKAMTASELAWSVEELVKLGLPQAEVAKKLGVSESQISVLSRISRLSPLVSEAFKSGQIKSARAAYDLDRLTPALQKRVLSQESPDKRRSIGQKDVQLIKDSWKFNSRQESHPFLAPALPQREYDALQAVLADSISETYEPKEDQDRFFGADRPLDSMPVSAKASARNTLVFQQDLSLIQAHHLVRIICAHKGEPEPGFLLPNQHPSAEILASWIAESLKNPL
jgi:ParB/RepB/Spo0J family partition protein